MKVNRLKALAMKHRALESAIALEMSRPMPDQIRLRRLKSQKLRTKDELGIVLGKAA